MNCAIASGRSIAFGDPTAARTSSVGATAAGGAPASVRVAVIAAVSMRPETRLNGAGWSTGVLPTTPRAPSRCDGDRALHVLGMEGALVVVGPRLVEGEGRRTATGVHDPRVRRQAAIEELDGVGEV